MFDIGWTELLLIGIVALIVVGPKDLPMMFRTLGRFTAKMKGMAREFQRAMDDAARESGVDDVAKDLRKATSSKNLGLDALNNAADSFEKWQPGKKAAPRTSEPAKVGSATAKLGAERAAAAEATRTAAAERAEARQAASSGVETAAPSGAGADTAAPPPPATAKDEA